jgi:hypothetical protein
MGFFVAGTTNGTDTNGLTAAYRHFVGGAETLTNDFDSDGLPDIWEILNFGNLDQTADGDYDGDDVSNMEEYVAGTDPNKIMFSAFASNQYVNFSQVPLQTTVSAGVPCATAALVDSTNFAAASWVPYNPHPSADLGTYEGWHEVWVGLRGRLNTSQQTWQWMRLKLDLTPPQLAISDPPSDGVSQPMIQLKGYSPESLSVISCDVSNTSGVSSNQIIVLLDSFYDTNTYEYTTNWFQGFDLRLADGLNSVVVRATDRAGNRTTTNFNFTLAGDTVAPVVELWWPQDRSELCGDTFTWRGLVDDFTATLTAAVADAGGNTNVSKAIVERDGKFWFENLPLADGTNSLTLTAVDYWGISSATNITVIKSAVQLTIEPLDESTLNEATITVKGTINVSDHTVWVNGVMATQYDGGTWQADDVPLPPGGTAVIQARAIPNGDNGGYGTGGGGSSPTMQNPGNPSSPQQKDRGAKSDKPSQFYLYKDDVNQQSDHRKVRTEIFDNESSTMKWHTGEYWNEYEQHWLYDPQSNRTGHGHGSKFYKEHDEDSVDGAANYGNCELTFVWPVGPYGAAYVTACDGSNSWMAAPGIISEHCEVRDPPPTVFDTGKRITASGYEHGRWELSSYTRKADARWRLFTGGKERAVRNALWCITGNASEIINKRAQRPFTAENTRAIDKSHIKVFGKVLASDGAIFKTLPNGQHIDVPFEVSGEGSDFYTFGPGGSPYYLISRCKCPRQDLDRTAIGVGEQVDLSWSSTPAGSNSIAPQGEPIAWTTSAGSVSPTNTWPTLFTAPSNSAGATATAKVRDEECPITFDVKEPTAVATIRGKADSIGEGVAGAGMQMDSVLQPTNVSFGRVEIEEPGEATTGAEGYFATHPPFTHDSDHGANVWRPVEECGNRVPGPAKDNFDHASYTVGGWAVGQGGGKFTWPIHAVWRVGAGDVNHPLSGWTDQVFELDSAGTMTIKKLGLQVRKGLNEERGIAQ